MAVKILLLAVAVTLAGAQNDVILFEAITAAELRVLVLAQNPALLLRAATTGSRIHIEITGAMQAAIVQEDVNANLDCLPWLSNFPGGDIQWLFQQRDENAVFLDLFPSILAPPGTALVNVGDQTNFNRWANITRTTVVSSAQDSTSGDYTCSVCIARNTSAQICHNATTTVFVLGRPPVLQDVETDICLDVGEASRITLPCINDVVSTPTAQITWVKDDVEIYSVEENITPEFNMDNIEFIEANPIFMPGLVVPTLLIIDEVSGTLIFDTTITNITMGIDQAELMRERIDARNALIGTYTCTISNVYGEDEVVFTIRDCGDAPVLPGCVMDTLTLQDQAVAPVGCSVCIMATSTISLDCTVSIGTEPLTYSWVRPNGVMSNMTVLTDVNEEGNYTCNVANADMLNGVALTTEVFFSPMGEISGVVKDVFGTQITGNGCDRLRSPLPGNATFDFCVLLGETLDLSCINSDTNEPINLTFESGSMLPETILVTDETRNYTVFCGVVTNTPCGTVTTMATVIVHDPARVNTSVVLADGEIGAGQTTSPIDVAEGASVTIVCPTSGNDDPQTSWTMVVVNATGVARERVLSNDDAGVSISDRDGFVSVLTISAFNRTVDSGVYVCRTENIVGNDAAFVALAPPDGAEWEVSGFGACNIDCADGVMVQSVTCRSTRDGRLVPNDQCTDPRPASQTSCDFTEPCNITPLYVVGEFGSCSEGCSGGFRVRDVACTIPRIGKVVKDRNCFPQTRPSNYETCPNTCCIDDRYSACKRIGSNLCNFNLYQQRCCWSCMLRALP